MSRWVLGSAGLIAATAALNGLAADPSDPLLNVLIKKGILTEKEADDIKIEAQNAQTNAPTPFLSKWKISDGIKSVELFGDLKFRYEHRAADAPDGQRLIRDRERYAVRIGIRGDLAEHFYYGLRLETSSNPRSTWVTFGDESSFPFPGPSAKTSDTVNIGQVYLGWRPEDWVDLTIGKFPNPFYTTSMVWDTDINPEGFSEQFKYTTLNDKLDLRAKFMQMIYQDITPNSSVLGVFPGNADNTEIPFLLAWRLGATYHFGKTMSASIDPTLYNYTSHGQNGFGVINTGGSLNPAAGFGGTFVGEGVRNPDGSFQGGNYPGGTVSTSAGPFFNQTGINDLMIVELPAEFNVQVSKLNLKIFGDLAINLDGDNRARQAALVLQQAAIPGITAQTGEDKAYQIGMALSNTTGTPKKGTWEARVYWQHIEQYALDVNLIDSDYFEGRGNLEGVSAGFIYNFTDNIFGSIRYGHADRINKSLGTGGSNQDLPWLNPINNYNLVQVDLGLRF